MSNDWIAMPLDALAFALQLAGSIGAQADPPTAQPWRNFEVERKEDDVLDTLAHDVSVAVLREYDRLLAA